MNKKRILLFIPAPFFAILIFILSHQPQTVVLDLGFDFHDKLLHIVEYFLFGITLIIFFGNLLSDYLKIICYTVMIGCLYGASDEIHQYFIPGRQCEIWDWFADALGILISVTIFYFLNKYRNKLIELIFTKQ